MRYNADQLRAWLAWTLDRHARIGGRTELRALGKGARRGVWSAFVGPEDLDAIVAALAPLPGAPRSHISDWPRSGEANLYFGLNPVRLDRVPARDEGRLFTRVARTTRDADVLAYTMLAIDVDPERAPRDRAATDAEKGEARAVADAVRAFLREHGIDPLFADSGNGFHLLTPLVPSDTAGVAGAAQEAHALLCALDRRFSTAGARIDTTTANPSRILKLYGTLAMKGVPTMECPHRVASMDLAAIPADIDLVARLAHLAGHDAPAGPATPAENRPRPAPSIPAPTAWTAWRARALAALPLDRVYGAWLTGRTCNGWLQCRDPEAATGDQNPSAGVADTATDAERGTFHSFRDGRTVSVFDFLIARGVATDFRSACDEVARRAGVPVPGTTECPIHRFQARWDMTEESAERHALVREALAHAAHLPAIEQRDAMAAIRAATGLPPSVLNRTLAELRRSARRAVDPVPAECPASRARPNIDYVQNRDTVQSLFDAIVAVLAPARRLYRQGRTLVFVCRDDGPVVVHERNLPGLVSSLAELRFLDEGDDGTELVGYDVLPLDLARAFVHSPRVSVALPVLRAYTRTPLFDRDWTLVGRPGFHEASGTWYDGPPIDAAAGTELLDQALGGFHWRQDADRVNLVGALLTALTMPHWGQGHPFLAINGNKPGVGKSTLAKLVGAIVEGAVPSTVSYQADDAEMEKQLATRVEAGDRVVVVDNAKARGPLESAVLERCVTDGRITFRRLGSNTAITRPENDILFCITMNLAQMGADLRRRALPVNLALEVEVRDAAYALDDVVGWALDHRTGLLAELVGIVARWRDAGRPLAEVPARHSTGQRWAATIDGMLTCAGMPGFLSNFEASTRDFDPRYALMVDIARAHPDGKARTPGEWAAVLGDVLADKFRDRSGQLRSDRAQATLVGALFGEYAGTAFDVDGQPVRLLREWPEGTGRSAVWTFSAGVPS